MQTVLDGSSTSIAARNFFETLPEKIKVAIRAYAEEMDYPIESVIEIAIAVSSMRMPSALKTVNH